MDNFIQIPFTKENLDRWYIRNCIFSFINKSTDQFDRRLLDIGCGKMPYKDFILKNSKVEEYVGLDLESAIKYDSTITPDFTWDGRNIPFDSSSFDSAMATEVLEHCPEPEIVLREIYRILKPGGSFFFTVPFLWNLHEVPNDEYRYTPFALEKILKSSGFEKIELQATGGWHASLAQMLGLWVRRSPISKNKRKILSFIFKPVIKYLIQLDKNHLVTFKDGQMITGISGFAIKE